MRTGQRIDARETQRAAAVFRVAQREEFAFGGAAGGPELSQGRAVLVYEGDLQGEGIVQEFRAQFTDRSSTMTGLQQVTGKLGDRSGTFVLNCTGKLRSGLVSGRHIVMPGSATGALKGLRGKMVFHSKEAEVIPVVFHYYFA